MRRRCEGGQQFDVGARRTYDLEQLDRTGTLEAGKLADIAVFDTNVLEVSPEDARSCKCLLTMVDGSIVYDAFEK